MFFEIAAILLAGAGQVATSACNRSRIEEWKRREYDDWQRWYQRLPNTVGPPPLSSSWWDDAIRPDDRCHTVLDGQHFIRCKIAYMDANR